MLGESGLGKVLIYLGLIIVVIGVIINYFGGAFSWLGHLPGDIRIEKENFRSYFPITTMLVISLILNLIIKLINLFL